MENNKLTFDHDKGKTMHAVLINDKCFDEWLYDHKTKEEQQHLMSCMEVFTSSIDGNNFAGLAKTLFETDFKFEIKVNIAWQIGMNLKHGHEQGKEINNQIREAVRGYEKKSIWLEYVYEDENNPVNLRDARILLVSMMHALIA